MPQKLFPQPPEIIGPASLMRRLAAIVYDSLLVIALLMLTTGLYMYASAEIMGSEHYREVADSGATIGDPLLTITLFLTLYGFFGYFWTKSGQTLGMQAWNIRIQNVDDSSITWLQALARLLGCFASLIAFGLGYAWILIDENRRSWQCMLSRTCVVRIAKIK
jgi:uncharacterized RDD family membrane protein YckC